MDGVAAKQPGAALARAIASLYRFGCERPFVERYQQGFEPRPQRFNRSRGIELSQGRELRAADTRDPRRRSRRARGRRLADPCGRARAHADGFDDGHRCGAALGDLDLQASGDRVLRVDLQGGVERRGRVVELTALEIAARQPCQRAFVFGRELRQLEVGRERLRSEVTGLA